MTRVHAAAAKNTKNAAEQTNKLNTNNLNAKRGVPMFSFIRTPPFFYSEAAAAVF